MNRILVADSIAESGVELLRKHPGGFEVDVKTKLSPDELVKIVDGYDAIIVRSATKITGDILNATESLRVVGRAGIGVDNIDVETATQRGVVVMNTPGGNAVTAAEHAIALMLAVARKVPQAAASMRAGRWEKSKFMGAELTGKTLGVVGLGHIGRIVASRGQGLQMKVIAFDPFLTEDAASRLGIEKVTLEDLLPRADVITVHTPLTEETRDLLSRETFARCKRGVIVINAARGGIVNEADLLTALDEGIVSGAGIDVFTEEPAPEDHPFRKRDEIVLTPHLGASTAEAQEKVAIQIAEQIASYLHDGEIRNAVNFPPIGAEELRLIRPFLDLGQKMGSLVGQLTAESGAVKTVRIDYTGEVSERSLAPITAAVLRGLMSPALDRPVNYVNAPVIAADRGIKVLETKSAQTDEFTSQVTLTVELEKETLIVSGTVIGMKYVRIVRFNDFYLEAVPDGYILVLRNRDVPGVVGSLGTLLGKRSVNIARLQLGRRKEAPEAVAFLNVDSQVSDDVLREIAELPAVIDVRQVHLE